MSEKVMFLFSFETNSFFAKEWFIVRIQRLEWFVGPACRHEFLLRRGGRAGRRPGAARGGAGGDSAVGAGLEGGDSRV